MAASRFQSAVLLFALVGLVSPYYLPGVTVKNYEDGEPVKLKVNKLTSTETQLPHAYYDLPFCEVSFVPNSYMFQQYFL